MGLLMERLRARRRAEQVNTPMMVIPIVPAPLRKVTRPKRDKPTRTSVMPKLERKPSTCATCGVLVGGKQKDVRYCANCWPAREQELHRGYYAKVVASRPPKPQVPCARCGTVFTQPTVRTRYCSNRCRQAVRIEQNAARRRLSKEVRITPLPKRISVKPGSVMEAEIAHNAESRERKESKNV